MGGLFGIIMARVSAKTPSGTEAVKGAVNGAILWATTLSLGNLLKLDGLAKVSAKQMTTLLY